jgi:hypothetical protein
MQSSMDGESIVRDLFQAIPLLPQSKRCFVEENLDAELPNILSVIQHDGGGDVHGPPLNCQMDTLGRHLLHLMTVLEKFSRLLVNESSFSNYTDTLLSELVEEDDGTLLDYVDTKFETLRYVLFCHIINQVW